MRQAALHSPVEGYLREDAPMERSIALGLVASAVIGAACILAAALPTVLSRPSVAVQALDAARESVKTAIDAPRPEDVAAAMPATPNAAKPAAAAVAAPSWIWSSSSARATEKSTFARVFTLDAPATDVVLVISADNRARVMLDGREVAVNTEWEIPSIVEIGTLTKGEHELIIEAQNEGGVGAVCAQLDLTKTGGVRARVTTDGSWEVRGGEVASGEARPATVIARYGDAPWGAVFGELDNSAHADIERAIAVPPGFICEVVYVAPPARGSIIAMTPDARGRLIVSPQRGKAFAITPCKDGADASESTIELIKPDIGEAHGLLAVDNDLFAVVSRGGPDEQGLWRLRDEDRDGTYDDKKLLATFANDGGEHGPHQIEFAPDGSLWIVGGNHCAPPDAALEHSKVPKLWQEDIAFDRLWDPNGHAVGVMAPGGWVVRTDREGAKWELMTVGFRNSYDLAFDELGRAFTFDSDMEWDMGLPWYRPTRVCELASGVDYGWRSGSGKWPNWSPDSFPAAVDVGPASPTGVLSSAGLMFPPPYNDCMFFLDWTFGTMWAAWPTDESVDASSPNFRIEPFVAGRPLPLTDAVTMDGSMYFAVGGRNVPSAIYRVRAENPIAIKRAAKVASPALVERRMIETLHHRLEGKEAIDAVNLAWNALGSSDAGVRSAGRIALEHQSTDLWCASAVAESDAQRSILALVALCRAGNAARDGNLIGERLAALESTVRGTALEREWLRACELWFLRFVSQPNATISSVGVRDALLAHFPAKNSVTPFIELDTHRVNLLAKIGAPEAVSVALVLLERPESGSPPKIDAALLARGGPYGKAVNDMLANAPATEKIGIAYAVRNAKNGWSAELRQRFARAIAGLSKGTGGNSFSGFLSRINEEFLSGSPESERSMLATISTGGITDSTLPIARGPGRAWTVEAIVALAPKLVAGRDHAEGLRAYQATQCAVCHRAGGVGGSGGPELTAVSRRFSLEDLAASLVEPSRTISDQYHNSDVRLKDGRVMSGRIVGDAPDAIELRASLLSDSRERILKTDIASVSISALSPMPAHLVDSLSEGELLDLLAFLRAGGNAGDSAFAKCDDDGYLELFNGTSLSGFTFDSQFWSLDNSQLVGRTTTEHPAPHNTFFVWDGEVRDFELEVDLKVNGNNSGVQYRSSVFDSFRMRGPQIDAHPASNYVAMCYEEGGRGILAERGSALVIAADGTRTTSVLEGASAAAPDISQWHTYRVVARGNTVEHFLDGVPTAKITDDSNEQAKGAHFGIQIHAGEPMEVRMRSARLKRLDR